MLRNTGFFRGIDCPFHAEHGQGKDGRNGCNRPYCHFRHSHHHRRPSYGAPADVKKQKDLQSAQNGTGHDGCFQLHSISWFIIYLFIYFWASMSSPVGEANRKRQMWRGPLRCKCVEAVSLLLVLLHSATRFNGGNCFWFHPCGHIFVCVRKKGKYLATRSQRKNTPRDLEHPFEKRQRSEGNNKASVVCSAFREVVKYQQARSVNKKLGWPQGC